MKKVVLLLTVFLIVGISCSQTKKTETDEIQWYSFEEGLKLAKQQNKLILLDIYAKWCHWCNVMENTTYRDKRVIELIKKYYIPVRVDADKEPDLNKKYNQGGLPSTVILDPEGNIVFGAIYIPPDDMVKVLSQFAQMSKEDIKHFVERNKLREELRFKRFEKATKEKEISESFINLVYNLLERKFDEKYGGLEGAPKFPDEELPYFLMLHSLFHKSSKTHLIKTLDAYGKLIDKVEGGIYRYGTQEDWSAPHYEKLLKDQGDLAVLFFNAYSYLNKLKYKEYANLLIKFAKEKLYDKNKGYFYNSQGADIVDEHGTLLVTGEEYFVEDEEGRKIIEQKVGYKPNIDKTIYFGNNALMAQAMLYSYAYNGSKEDFEIGKKVIDNIIKDGLTENGVKHSPNQNKYYLNAQVYFLEALLTMYQVSADKRYLNQAVKFADLMINKYFAKDINLFTDLEEVGYNIKRISFISDILALNSRAVKQLYGLYVLTEDTKFKTYMEKVVKAIPRKINLSTALAYYVYFYPPLITHIIGSNQDKELFISKTFSSFPYWNFTQFIDKNDKEEIQKLGYKIPDKTTAYICNSQTCFKQVKDPYSIREKIFEILKNYKPSNIQGGLRF